MDKAGRCERPENDVHAWQVLPKRSQTVAQSHLGQRASHARQENNLGSFSGISQTAAPLSGGANAMQAAQGPPNQFRSLQLLSSMVKT